MAVDDDAETSAKGKNLGVDTVHRDPSLVVLVTNLASMNKEADLLAALSMFGPIAYVTLKRNKKTIGLVEFEELEAAQRCVNYAQPITVFGSIAMFNYSSMHTMIKRMGLEGVKPKNVLTLTIYNVRHPITCKVIHEVCNPHGTVQRIVIVRRHMLQVLVEYETIEIAKKAKHALNGADIYPACCTLRAEYAREAVALTVTRNDDDQHDYTRPDLPSVAPPRKRQRKRPAKDSEAPERRTYDGRKSGAPNVTKDCDRGFPDSMPSATTSATTSGAGRKSHRGGESSRYNATGGYDRTFYEGYANRNGSLTAVECSRGQHSQDYHGRESSGYTGTPETAIGYRDRRRLLPNGEGEYDRGYPDRTEPPRSTFPLRGQGSPGHRGALNGQITRGEYDRGHSDSSIQLPNSDLDYDRSYPDTSELRLITDPFRGQHLHGHYGVESRGHKNGGEYATRDTDRIRQRLIGRGDYVRGYPDRIDLSRSTDPLRGQYLQGYQQRESSGHNTRGEYATDYTHRSRSSPCLTVPEENYKEKSREPNHRGESSRYNYEEALNRGRPNDYGRDEGVRNTVANDGSVPHSSTHSPRGLVPFWYPGEEFCGFYDREDSHEAHADRSEPPSPTSSIIQPGELKVPIHYGEKPVVDHNRMRDHGRDYSDRKILSPGAAQTRGHDSPGYYGKESSGYNDTWHPEKRQPQSTTNPSRGIDAHRYGGGESSGYNDTWRPDKRQPQSATNPSRGDGFVEYHGGDSSGYTDRGESDHVYPDRAVPRASAESRKESCQPTSYGWDNVEYDAGYHERIRPPASANQPTEATSLLNYEQYR